MDVINYLIALQPGWMVRRCSQSKYCNEETKFTCAVWSNTSITRLTLTYMWSKSVNALSIHVTGVMRNRKCILNFIFVTLRFLITLIISINKQKLSLFRLKRTRFFETCNLDIISLLQFFIFYYFYLFIFFLSPNMMALKQTGCRSWQLRT